MIELVAILPFVILSYNDYKKTAVKNWMALLFLVLAFAQAVVRYDFATASVVFALAMTLSLLMFRFRIIRQIDILIFAGYSLLVMNFIWVVLAVAVISVFSFMNLKKGVISPMTPALFLLFLIYYIGYLGVVYFGV